MVLLLLLFTLLTTGARQLSYTADELAHLAGGYAVWDQGAAALELLAQRGYPPLMPVLEAWLTFAFEPRVPVTTLDGWPDAFDVFSNAYGAQLRAPGAEQALARTILVSRMPAIWLAVLLAALVARWGRELWGTGAGLAALAFLTVDPTFLAHGRLATTDLGVTALGTAALIFAWHTARSGRWRPALWAGGFLGATLLAKVSGATWGAAAVVIMGVGALQRGGLWQRLAQVAAMGGISLAILWAGNGFGVGPVAGIPFSVPAPAYWHGLRYLTHYSAPFFALGEHYTDRRWWYFPLAFLIKNPLPLLAVWGGGAVVLLRALLRRRRATSPGEELLLPPSSGSAAGATPVTLLALGLFPALYGGIALASGMNIGYRHLLPVHPFLHLVGAAGVVAVWRRGGLLRRAGVTALGLAAAVVTLRMVPNEIAFFNLLVGGPAQGYHYLVDSNLDWGQRNALMEQYLADHPEVHHAAPSTPFRPAAGRYIYGASQLQGVGTANAAAYAWFRRWAPTTELDYSFLIFDVPPVELRWLAQCAVPVLPLDDAAIAAGLGAGAAQSVRRLGFDCTQSWVYPDGGTTPGLYALRGELLAPGGRQLPSLLLKPPVARDPFVAERLAPLRLAYEDQNPAAPFALYEAAGGQATGDWALPGLGIDPVRGAGTTGGIVGGLTPPAEAGMAPQCAPCRLEGPLAFLGMTVSRSGERLDLETWWRVTEGPIARNFSIAAHLLAADGAVLGTADGMGVWPTLLQPGDVFVQRHSFDPAQAAGARWLRTGAYWLDTLAPWRVEGAGDMLYVPLGDALP